MRTPSTPVLSFAAVLGLAGCGDDSGTTGDGGDTGSTSADDGAPTSSGDGTDDASDSGADDTGSGDTSSADTGSDGTGSGDTSTTTDGTGSSGTTGSADTTGSTGSADTAGTTGSTGTTSSGGTTTGGIAAREIVMTVARYGGDLGGVSGADGKCNVEFPGYKAMISDGTNRIASVSPSAGDGQVDWVLQPDTTYVDGNGTTLWTTDGRALLGSPLDTVIDLSWDGWGAWTGMLSDWTASVDCDDWADGTSGSSGRSGISNHASNYLNNNSTSLCDAQRHLYCVEQ